MTAALSVFAVVVTYNRKSLLDQCLKALVNQSRSISRIIVVDNASIDGTEEMLACSGWLDRADFKLIKSEVNLGGAGGFALGLEVAVNDGANWVWMMDDDALPHVDALERLLDRELDEKNIYGSVAVTGQRLAWPMMPIGGKKKRPIVEIKDLSNTTDVQFIPFLGILISSAMTRRIGYPDASFFLAADDVEYCMRARQAGAKVILVGSSLVTHPLSERYRLLLPFRGVYSLKLAPWKRYYDVRNRIFVARKYYGAALWYKTIPGSLLRLIATLWHEGNRGAQIKAFSAGMLDGLLSRGGRRHDKWNIK